MTVALAADVNECSLKDEAVSVMPAVLDPTDLNSVIEELRCRLLAIHLTDVRITPLGQRLLVDARFHDSLTIGNVRRCCDELSRQTGIPISVTCMLC
jgi:hypothetical protein